MSFQIAKIAIYGPNLEIRELNFRLGAVNIVTGDSATGKTSLFHIINYCLGAKDCRIPHGPIRKCVLWYGLLLQFSDYQMFVARKAPDPGSAISEAFHVKVGKQVRIPAFEELGPTDTTATVMSSLASHIRIAENLTEPEASRTSDPIEASFRHALAFCLQHQNDLSSDTHIFQGTQNHFKLLALRDCLPYFLGAMETDRLKEQARLRELRTQLRKLLRKQKAGEDSNEAALLDATGLLSEAAEVGLIPGMPVMPSLREALDELSRAVCYRLASETDLASQISPEFQRQQRERASLIRQLHQTDDKIDELSEFVSEQDAYTHVLQEERSRLRPVNALLDFDCSECPLCGEALSSTVPAVAEIRKSLGVLEAQLSGVNKDRPHLSSRIERLRAEREFIKERLRTRAC